VEIASIPEDIRGYGHVKERNLAAARTKWKALLARWSAPARGAAGTGQPVVGVA
jgi:indolepyruvate ferredoxin oxidoreductase